MNQDQRPSEATNLRVVVIDDSRDFRHLMRTVLDHSQGFKCVGEAGSGLEGLLVVRAHDPDVVLIELAMPIIGGRQVLPLIREFCPEAVLVLTSAYVSGRLGGRVFSFSDEAILLGADGFIHKGPRMSAMMACLVTVLNSTGRWPSPGGASTTFSC